MARTSRFIFIVAFCAAYASAATIQSATGGGNWDDTLTWVGFRVPGANDDVIIAGPVQMNQGTCHNLTVNAGAVLKNVWSNWGGTLHVLKVSGDLANNGEISNYSSSEDMVTDVKGNISNNGTWKHKTTYMRGKLGQTISAASWAKFEGNVSLIESGTISATTAIMLSAEINLGTGVLDMKSFGLTLSSPAATIYDGRVVNMAELTGVGFPVLNNITYEGTISMKGGFTVRGVSIKGKVTIADTLRNYYANWAESRYNFVVAGDLVNNGVILNNGAEYLILSISGNITNNGIWKNYLTTLQGKPGASISAAAGKSMDGAVVISDSGTRTATSPLTIGGDFNLNTGVLDMQKNTLTLSGGAATVHNGRTINTADLIAVNYPQLHDCTYEGDIFMKGVFILWGATMKGKVTISDTLRNHYANWAESQYKFVITGDLVNNGVITLIDPLI